MRVPQRVPIGSPSRAEKLMVVSTLWPSLMAHRLAPLPRWATMTRPPLRSGARRRKRPAMYS